MDNKLLFGIILAFAFASAAYGAAIGMGNATIAPGGTAVVPITLTGMDDFGGVDVNISYNPNVVNINDITSGLPGALVVPNINNTIGLARAAVLSTPTPGPNSPLTIFKVELKAVGLAGKPEDLVLGLSVGMLVYTNGTQVVPTVSNGTFAIVGNVVPHAQITGNLTGKILSEASGLPIPNATVKLYNGSVYDSNALYASATADESGGFTLSDLAPGEYQLVAEAQGYGSVLTVTSVVSGKALQAGSVRLPPEIANKSEVAQPPAQPPAQTGAGGKPAASQDYTLTIAGIAVVAIIAAIAFFLARRKPGMTVPPKAPETKPPQ